VTEFRETSLWGWVLALLLHTSWPGSQPFPRSAPRHGSGGSRSSFAATPDEAAVGLLAAIRTDPAVQDAVLAALVEGGRLIREEVGRD